MYCEVALVQVSSAKNRTPSGLPSRLPFRFLWLCWYRRSKVGIHPRLHSWKHHGKKEGYKFRSESLYLKE